jgi:hypothetical protein
MKISDLLRVREALPGLSLLPVSALALTLGLLTAGCGSGNGPEGGSGPPAGGSSSSASADDGGSPLNTGPKAVETVAFNPGLADWGAKAFEKHACVTCHAIGEQKQGPDLAGVAKRRTERWMRRQITDPEYMVKNDPIAREMYAKFALQMANQHVPPQDVDALIQFLVRESLDN